jgi:hypothetical protein
MELEFQAIRRLLVDLLLGNRTLPMDVRSLPQMRPSEPVAEAKELPPANSKS